MSVEKVLVPKCTCERCGRVWIPHNTLKDPNRLPVRCANPKCMSPYWNISKPPTVKQGV